MYGQVAQLVEQGTENPRVGSSILSLATIINYLACSLPCNSSLVEVLRKLTNAKPPQDHQFRHAFTTITHTLCGFNQPG